MNFALIKRALQDNARFNEILDVLISKPKRRPQKNALYQLHRELFGVAHREIGYDTFLQFFAVLDSAGAGSLSQEKKYNASFTWYGSSPKETLLCIQGKGPAPTFSHEELESIRAKSQQTATFDEFKFPLRKGNPPLSFQLPNDLTSDEAERICQFIKIIAHS